MKREQEKENLRLEYANLAKEFTTWAGATCNTLMSAEFGNTLSEVVSYKVSLDDNTQRFTEELNKLKEAISANLSAQAALCVESNPHSNISPQDIEDISNTVLASLADLNSRYAQELERQQVMDRKKQEFASEATKFKEFLESIKQEIDSLNGLSI